MNLWKFIQKISDFVIPDWLFRWLKKHPFMPLIIVLSLYVITKILSNSDIFPIPCISIFGNECFEMEQPSIRPYRGYY